MFDLFEKWVEARVSAAKNQRGLATMFHQHMVEFQKKVSKEDWLPEYAAVTTKIEERLESALEDGETLKDLFPEWKQYKSKYKQALKKGMDLSKYKTYSDFVRNGLYKDSDNNGGGSRHNSASGGKGGGNAAEDKVKNLFEAKLSPSVAKQLARLADIIANVPEEDALSVLSRTESILRGIVKGNKKMGVAAAATK